MNEAAFHALSADETFSTLNSTTQGLSSKEAASRLSANGPNDLISAKPSSRLAILLAQFKDLLVAVLIVAGIISFCLAFVEGSWENYRNGTIIFLIVIVDAALGFGLEYKASRIVRKLRSLILSPARAMRDGRLSEIPLQALVPGDVIHIEQGDKIPADLRIVESNNLRTNEFSLTGESMPVDKDTEKLAADLTVADRINMAFAGTTVASGNGVGVVVHTGMRTELGKIAAMTEDVIEVRSPLQDELNVLAIRLTIVAGAISGGLLVLALWSGLDWLVAVTYALGVAVACVPQALPAQLTVAMSSASQHLARKNAVVKNLPTVETLGSTNVICTDKTGTVTRNEMTVTRAWIGERELQFTGVGYRPDGEVLDEASNPVPEDAIRGIDLFFRSATLASTGTIHPPDDLHEGWYAVGDPSEAALVAMSMKAGIAYHEETTNFPELRSFPFDTERKRMSSVRRLPEGDFVLMKGAPDTILDVCVSIRKDGNVQPMTREDRKRIDDRNIAFSDQALRVLALAYRQLDGDPEGISQEEAERDMVFLGLAGMIDPPRKGVREAMRKCHNAGIDIYMITGDHAATAAAIARDIGLGRNSERAVRVVRGKDMAGLGDEELAYMMHSNAALIFSRVEPAHKLRVVRLLGEQGRVVAVTGDGINDAPALKRAHIGVAMGRTGVDVAKEVAEVVLLDDNFSTLVDAVEEGRSIYSNIHKVVLASLTTNIAELLAVLLGLVGIAIGNYAIPMLTIQILAIDLFAEILPLTFLCFDPPTKDDMRRPPRNRRDHILNPATGLEIGFLGSLIGALSVGNFFLYMQRHGLNLGQDAIGTIEYARASAMTWLTMAFCQFANILSRRYRDVSIFNRNILTNRILLGAVILSAGQTFLAVHAPGIRQFLGFAPIGIEDWLYVFGAAAIFLTAWEGIKWKRRRSTSP
ncbi:HAD-IC family P-type ATPase [Pseudodesulfovibrio cashew]|uniref:HAD-IC family P-type ATPase n=1 Tax=Pseudodesulfovibrio cashew TaxID=2678688 RepID=A0A6I6JSA5_9BACT|nr:cation-transporting P-type ATPase [Pseudodesulfovibrio cashew]QGY40434.1 HAD-IC family P-type ATPase [Pseudodesulfovibrio cashew]